MNRYARKQTYLFIKKQTDVVFSYGVTGEHQRSTETQSQPRCELISDSLLVVDQVTNGVVEQQIRFALHVVVDFVHEQQYRLFNTSLSVRSSLPSSAAAVCKQLLTLFVCRSTRAIFRSPSVTPSLASTRNTMTSDSSTAAVASRDTFDCSRSLSPYTMPPVSSSENSAPSHAALPNATSRVVPVVAAQTVTVRVTIMKFFTCDWRNESFAFARRQSIE